jgi:hypothetical protein
LHYYPGALVPSIENMLTNANKSNKVAAKQKAKGVKKQTESSNNFFCYWKKMVPVNLAGQQSTNINLVSPISQLSNSKVVNLDLDDAHWSDEVQRITDTEIELIDGIATGPNYTVIIRASCVNLDVSNYLLQKIRNGATFESLDEDDIQFRIFVKICNPSRHYMCTKPDGLCGYRSEFSMYKSAVSKTSFLSSDPCLNIPDQKKQFSEFMIRSFPTHPHLTQILSYADSYTSNNSPGMMDQRY